VPKARISPLPLGEGLGVRGRDCLGQLRSLFGIQNHAVQTFFTPDCPRHWTPLTPTLSQTDRPAFEALWHNDLRRIVNREGKAPAEPRHLARAEASLRCGRSLTLPGIESSQVMMP
jgi:hypothetical protein